MDDLLKLAIEAHGGLERWRQFKEARASVSITGALWHLFEDRPATSQESGLTKESTCCN